MTVTVTVTMTVTVIMTARRTPLPIELAPRGAAQKPVPEREKQEYIETHFRSVYFIPGVYI